MLAQFSIPGYESNGAASSVPFQSKKRACLVCFRCHEKKIKCDLAKKPRDDQRASRCSNCADADCPCLLRPSKRGKRGATSGRNDPRRDITVSWSADAPFGLPFAPPPADGSPAPGSSLDGGGDLEPMDTAISGNHGQVLTGATPPPADHANLEGQLVSHDVVPPPNADSRRRYSSYLGDSGYMQIFSSESGDLTMQQQVPRSLEVDYIPVGLQEAHLDVFFEYAFTWCPIFDRDTLDADPSLRQSLLLRHALALCANQIRPSLLHQSSSTEHYNRAKELFYGNHEPNPLIRIMALMLFYWWSSEAPNVVSLDNTSWWTGTAIRVAQQIGLHCEPRSSGPMVAGESPGLRRRIWWTLVARERITAISQGRPCLIDLDDCDVPMPSPSDFSQPHYIQVSLFVKWVPLCKLIGRISKMLRRRPGNPGPTAIQLGRELIAWVQALPRPLQPAFEGSRTRGFHRDVHGMHLTYLSTITLLHLSNDAQPLPQASVAAVVAASCTARIFHDYLVRGSICFLAGQAGWYATIAILALLHARRLEGLAVDAKADIQTLRAALSAMAKTWRSAQMFERGIEKLMLNAGPQNGGGADGMPARTSVAGPGLSPSMDELSAIAGINWRDYFPYVTGETSPLIGTLFAQDDQAMPFTELGWTFDFPTHLNQFLTGLENINLDFLSL